MKVWTVHENMGDGDISIEVFSSWEKARAALIDKGGCDLACADHQPEWDGMSSATSTESFIDFNGYPVEIREFELDAHYECPDCHKGGMNYVKANMC